MLPGRRSGRNMTIASLPSLVTGCVDNEIERCLREIANIEALILAGHPDLPGLCLALADWSMELRIIEASERETPPSMNPAARLERQLCGSGFHGIAALAVVALGGLDGQAHLLADRARQEAAHG